MNPASLITPATGLAHWARATPTREAVVDLAATWTFAELDELVSATAAALAGLGVQRGDVVAISMRNGVDALALPLAAARLGAIVSCLSFRLRRRELASMLELSRPRVVVYGDDIAAELAACEPLEGIEMVASDELRALAGSAPLSPSSSNGFGAPTDPYTLMWTSGTGGQPKPVVGSLMARMNWITSIGHVYRLAAEDRFLAAMPMTHSAGLTFALSHIFYGAPVYPLPRFDTGHAWGLLNDGGVTTGLYVPTMLEMLLDDDPEPSRPAGRVRAVMMAGARIRRSTHARLLRRFPGCVYNYYGSTESPSMTVLLPADQEAHPDSVGRPFMGVELEVRDVRSVEGHPQPLGEIVARNPFAMDRYLGDDGPGAFDTGAWLATGDLGFFDADGFLHVIGRESEVIISGGLNVSLPEVERVIAERPEVVDVAVVGLDDELWGQVPAAVVVLAEGVDETAALEAVERHCRAELADYKRPRHCRVVSSVPRTPSGKPRVPDLRRMFTESMSEAGRE